MKSAPLRATIALGLALPLLAACATSEGLPGPRVSSSTPAELKDGLAVAHNGDTMYSVAQRFNVPLNELTKANNVDAGHTLHEGELLHLPASANESASTAAADDDEDEGAAAPMMHSGEIMPPPAAAAPTGETSVAPAPLDSSVTSQPLDQGPQYQLQKGLAAQPATSPNAAATPAPAPSPASVSKEGVIETGGNPPPLATSSTIAPATSGAAPAAATAASAGVSAATLAFHWPLSGRVVEGFGKQADGTNNEGIDIQAPKGASVMAAAPGIVLYTGNSLKDLGNLVLIRHEGGWITAYAHLDHVLVEKDAVVTAGDPIGTVGSSGNAKAPGLHFEIRQGDNPVDPRKLLQAAG